VLSPGSYEGQPLRIAPGRRPYEIGEIACGTGHRATLSLTDRRRIHP